MEPYQNISAAKEVRRKEPGILSTRWRGVVVVVGGFLGLLFCKPAQGASVEPLSVVHWGADQGLAAGPIAAMAQTRDGYLWMGGEEGLMRFDGIHCEAFHPRNTAALKVKAVKALHEDVNSGLWVGLAGGGLVYRSEAGQWRTFGPEEGLSNERVEAIAQDSAGRLWVGTDGGGIFIGANGSFQTFAENDELPTKHIEVLLPDGDDGMWVGSGWPLCRIQGDGLDRAFTPTGDLPRSSLAVVRGPDGALWVGGRQGLYVLRSNQFNRALPGFDFGYVQAIAVGERERIWAGTRNGLVRLDGTRATRLTSAQGLSGKLVTTIYRDAEGSLWVTSEVPGVDQIRRTKFASISARPGFARQMATAVYEDRDHALWVGGHDGVTRISAEGSTHWTDKEGLSANLVFSIAEGPEHELWVGTSSGLNRLRHGKWSLLGVKEGLPHPAVWALYQGRQGELWAGTLKGLARIQSGKIETYTHDRSKLSHSDVRSICEDAEGRLWVGTSYGLNRLEEGGHFTQFIEAVPGVPFNAVIALHGDAAGDLWIGTMEQGLFRGRAGKFTQFNSAMGLHDDLILRILEDDTGHLWMSCNRGVFRVSKSELNAYAEGQIERIECQAFGKADGMPTIECNGTFQPAGWKSADGRLWFPTSKGVAVVDPNGLLRNSHPPPVRIEQTRVNGRSIPMGDSLQLGPGVENFSVQYTAMSFVAPEQVEFRYRLEGLDREWVQAKDRTARYAHLSPGKYIFRVMAANNDGVWNENGARLAFAVVPFWWQTHWFIVFAALASAGSIGGIARVWTARRYRRRMEEIEQRHALERERTRIATDLHDDLGSNLGSIALLSASARKSASGAEAEDLAEIQQLAESTAESMRDIVWFINSSEDELQPLVLRMKETAARLLGGMELEFEAPTSLPSRKLSTEFKRHFFLIFKESLNNVRKHARATKVRIDLSIIEEQVELVIADNGVGIVAGSAYSGLGLNSMRRRASTLGWKLNIGNNGSIGTRVHLVASLSFQHGVTVG